MTKTRATAALLAVYLTVIGSGAPLPITWVASAAATLRVAADPDVERFPCEGCGCGCGTASRCWSKCCCHTPKQRLAWARREGVRPPEDVLDAAEVLGLDVSAWRAARRARLAAPPQRLEATVVAELPPCCRAKQRCEAPNPSSDPSHSAPKRSQQRVAGVSVLRAMACQGIADAWLALGNAVAPPPLDLVVIAPEPELLPVLGDTLGRSLGEAPPTPPPDRRAFA
ncbi:MAG: hypothetical protein AAF805_02725 [Planctomycetota bacterium]